MIITPEIAQQLGLSPIQVTELNKLLAFINIKSVNELTSILNPTDGYIVFEDADGKLKKVPINTFYQLIGGMAKPIAPSDPTPTIVGWYKPRSYSATPGTNYPNLDNLKAVQGFDTLFYFDGTNWIDIQNLMPQATQYIAPFIGSTFPLVGSSTNPIQRTHENSIWELEDGETSTLGDVPGVSDKWQLIGSSEAPLSKELSNKNLLPYYAMCDSNYRVNIYEIENTVFVPETDLALKKLGIQFKEKSQINVRTKTTISDLSNKYVTVGVMLTKYDGVFPSNSIRIKLASNIVGNSNVSYPTGNLKTIDVDDENRFYYMQAEIPAGSDNNFIFINDSVYAGSMDFWSLPIISIGDHALSEVELKKMITDYEKTDYKPLLDQWKAENVSDYIQPVIGGGDTQVVVSDNKNITDIIPNGSAVLTPYNSTLTTTANFRFNYGAELQNKYIVLGIFAFDETGDFSHLLRMTPLFFNGSVDNYNYEDHNYINIPITEKVRYFQVTIKLTAVSSQYGATLRYQNQSFGADKNYYFFGAMSAVIDAPDDYKLQPVAFVPKFSEVKGYQLSDNKAANYLSGKKVVWMGTSIPTLGGYPETVCAELGANLAKISLGGGRVRAFNEDGSMVSQMFLQYMFTLKASEVQALYGGKLGQEVNPSDYSQLQTGGVVLTQPMIDALTQYNYENTLIPNLDADIFIIDYGINDRNGQTTYPFQSAEISGTDRKYFAGAVGFLVDLITTAKKAQNKDFQIIFISHHNRAEDSPNATFVVDAQEDIAKHWGGKFINLADTLGLNTLNLLYYTDGLHFTPSSFIAGRVKRYLVSKFKEL